MRLLIALAMAATPTLFAEPPPARTRDVRRPVHENSERVPYERRRDLPTVAEARNELLRWLAREFFPAGGERAAREALARWSGILATLEAEPRRATELAKNLTPLLRERLARREDGGTDAIVGLFRVAGQRASMAHQLRRTRDAEAETLENVYELLRLSSWLVLEESGRAEDAAEEPFTRVERARVSEPERIYREAFLTEWRRKR